MLGLCSSALSWCLLSQFMLASGQRFSNYVVKERLVLICNRVWCVVRNTKLLYKKHGWNASSFLYWILVSTNITRYYIGIDGPESPLSPLYSSCHGADDKPSPASCTDHPLSATVLQPCGQHSATTVTGLWSFQRQDVMSPGYVPRCPVNAWSRT